MWILSEHPRNMFGGRDTFTHWFKDYNDVSQFTMDLFELGQRVTLALEEESLTP